MRDKTKWLEKHAPLGIEIQNEVGIYILGVIVSTCQSLLFFLNYVNARAELYDYYGTKKVLIEGMKIQEFSYLIDKLFSFGTIVCIACLMMVAVHYMYHYQGSKMMYLMKRLPDKWELHKRCWTLPITGCVLMAAWMFVLRMIFYAVYILCTPSQCLPL